jgi:hypothetical protein
MSPPYSGTTLLGILLDSHPRIVSIGELDGTAFEHATYPCSCGVAIDECDFFRRVQHICAAQGVHLDPGNFKVRLGHHLPRRLRRLVFGSGPRFAGLQPLRDVMLQLLPTYRPHVKEVFDRNIAIASAALIASGKSIFVDTSKSLPRIRHLHQRREIDLHVIHIVRDARAVAWSGLKHDATGVDTMARLWKRTHLAAAQIATLLGKQRYMRFRLEDFCREPQRSLAQICTFLGAESVDLVSRVNHQPHHVIGNNMRLHPVRPIVEDRTWRDALTSIQLRALEREVGALNRSFGYE